MQALDQLRVLSDLFAEALMVRRPASVAVLGVAGGNGLERIDSGLTRRVVGIDLQPEYLSAVRERFGAEYAPELRCIDLAKEMAVVSAVDLVHAGLFFEHAGTGLALENALAMVAENGALSVVLQLPSAQEKAVGESGVASIQKLKDEFKLIDPRAMHTMLQQRGLEPVWETQRQQQNGKAFWMGIFAYPDQEEASPAVCGCGHSH